MQSIRERLHERQRKKRMRLLRLFLYLALLGGVVVGGWKYVHQPGFAFGQINISGTSLITPDDVVRMAGGQPPCNFFNMSKGRIQEALEHDIRFQSAQVDYRFPAILNVLVQEREPAVYVANSYRSYLKVDYQGVVMSVTTGIPDAKAPVLVGIQCGNAYLGDVVSDTGVQAILGFLRYIDEEARTRIAEINVDDRQNVRLQMRGSFPIYLGHLDDLAGKGRIFMTVFNEIKDKDIRAEYIDLTFAKPYVRLLPGEKK